MRRIKNVIFTAIVILLLVTVSFGVLRLTRSDNGLKINSLIVKKEKVLVAFGDSLTEGYGISKDDSYPSILEKKLDESGIPSKVINEGRSGETSYDGLMRVDSIVVHRPDYVLLCFGANDFLTGMDLNQTQQNLKEMIELLKLSGATIVLLGIDIPQFLKTTVELNTGKFFETIAENAGAKIIPSFLNNVSGNPELNLSDYLHPNKKGYEVIVDQNILPGLLPLIQE